MSPLDFKGRVGSLICTCMCYLVPWDSPVVQHPLTSWWPAWQSSQSLPCTCEQALVGLECGTYHAADERSTDSTELFSKCYAKNTWFVTENSRMQITDDIQNCKSHFHGLQKSCILFKVQIRIETWMSLSLHGPYFNWMPQISFNNSHGWAYFCRDVFLPECLISLIIYLRDIDILLLVRDENPFGRPFWQFLAKTQKT